MSYINKTTGQYGITEAEIRTLQPASYPTPFVAPEPFAYVFPAPPAAFNPITHAAVQTFPELMPLGHYEQRWQIVALPPEVVENNIAEAGRRLQADIVASTQRRLDEFAKTRNYDGILSAATYAFSAVPRFQSEGQYAVEARDATWAALYEILGEVLAGTRPAPSGYADIEPELPVLEWPAA